jgi:polyisoprenoid-binding protein YceI
MATQTTTKWAVDTAHSEVGFKLRHLMITSVSGKFEKFDGTVETSGDDFVNSTINFTADVDSVTTADEKRDGHLKAADFFDVAKYPKMKFVSTKIEKAGGNKYVVHGDFTIRDVTKPIKLDVEHHGTAKDPWGNTKAGFSINAKINRSDYGLSWNVTLETGGVLVSEEVKIVCEVQLVKQA